MARDANEVTLTISNQSYAQRKVRPVERREGKKPKGEVFSGPTFGGPPSLQKTKKTS